LTCGAVTTTVKIISYKPAFTATAFNGTDVGGATVTFTIASGIT